MAKQIRFFKKNIIDISNDEVTLTVTDAIAFDTGQGVVDYIRNRNNNSAWVTTNSTDAANTQLDVEWLTGRDVTSLILVKHNFKAFTIQYWDGAAFQDFSIPINQSSNSAETSIFEFNSVSTHKIRIIITGCQVVDDDKHLYQLIVSEKLGTGILDGWPVIQAPTHDTNKKQTKMLSGKIFLLESLGSFSCTLNVDFWRSANDLSIVEDVYFRREGVLLWLCGGDETQFNYTAIGYRLEDLYLVRPVNNYDPEWVKGVYSSGLKISMQLAEAIT